MKPRPVLCCLIPVLALLWLGVAAAQTTVDRAYVGVTYTHGTRIGSRGVQLADSPQVDVRLPTVPIFLGDTILLPSLSYEARGSGVDAQGAVASLSDDQRHRTFHGFQVGLTAIRRLTPDWMLTFGASGTTRTDFEQRYDLGLDTTWAGYAFAVHRLGGDPAVSLSFGLVASYPYEWSPVIPLVGFTYRKGRYIVDLTVPRVALLLKPTEGLELGVTAAFDRQVYRTGLPPEYQSLGAEYVRETALRAGLAANVKLGQSDVWLSSTVGLDFLNDYELLDGQREPVENHPNDSTRPTPFIRMLLSWRPPRRAPTNQPPIEPPLPPRAPPGANQRASVRERTQRW
jgi:hypothetical protein